jgi:hypothetical protein
MSKRGPQRGPLSPQQQSDRDRAYASTLGLKSADEIQRVRSAIDHAYSRFGRHDPYACHRVAAALGVTPSELKRLERTLRRKPKRSADKAVRAAARKILAGTARAPGVRSVKAAKPSRSRSGTVAPLLGPPAARVARKPRDENEVWNQPHVTPGWQSERQ